MKLITIIFFGFLTLFCSSCGSPLNSNAATDDQADGGMTGPGQDSLSVGDYCFIKATNEDTTVIRLRFLSADDIRGEMTWLPNQGDGAYGTLTGKLISANEMELRYSYTIEGSAQSEVKIMKIEEEQLMVKIGELTDPKNDGNLVYKDVHQATYSDLFNKINCEAKFGSE